MQINLYFQWVNTRTSLVKTMSYNVGPKNEFDQIYSYREMSTTIIAVDLKYRLQHIGTLCLCKAQSFNSSQIKHPTRCNNQSQNLLLFRTDEQCLYDKAINFAIDCCI